LKNSNNIVLIAPYLTGELMTSNTKEVEKDIPTEEPTGRAVLDGLNDFYSFASSPQGEKLISMFMKQQTEKNKWQSTPKYLVGGIAVLGGCILSYFGKFDPSIAVLLGSVIGYVLGKDSNN